MPEPDFEQIAATLLESIDPGCTLTDDGLDAQARTLIVAALRQAWNARGFVDQEKLEAALAAQHDEIWRGVETHWVRKEAIEDLSLRAAEAEERVNALLDEIESLGGH